MREILFRGKRTDTGEWVEGYYVRANHHWHKYGIHKDWIVEGACANGGWFVVHCKYPVKKETIGQYTGLKDKNGKKVFEGDIHRGYAGSLWVVCFGEFLDMDTVDTGYGWYLRSSDGDCSCFHGDEPLYMNIIGNIHDNPELMPELMKGE